uniref:Putative secreted protein n=1 Tax=Ixodes scapularis TaxID=6945 RepID=A0A4D5RCC3_IXOSC
MTTALSALWLCYLGGVGYTFAPVPLVRAVTCFASVALIGSRGCVCRSLPRQSVKRYWVSKLPRLDLRWAVKIGAWTY